MTYLYPPRRVGTVDPRDFRHLGPVDLTGVIESTVAVAAAFEEALTRSLPVFVPGILYTDTIDWKGQSFFGLGTGQAGLGNVEGPRSVLKGKPGKDVLKANASIGGGDKMVPNVFVHDIEILVDDSQDASASNPTRGTFTKSCTVVSGSPVITVSGGTAGIASDVPVSGTGIPAGARVIARTSTTVTISANASASGSPTLTFGYVVGNAGWSFDWADGSALAPRLSYGRLERVSFTGSGGVMGGRNNAVGFYGQADMTSSAIRDIVFDRLAYGYWADSPRSNPTAFEYASDGNTYDGLEFKNCGRACRFINLGSARFGNVMIHGASPTASYGIVITGVQSAIRSSSSGVEIARLETEHIKTEDFAFEGTVGLKVASMNIQGERSDPHLLGCTRSVFDDLTIGSSGIASGTLLRVLGSQNTLTVVLWLGSVANEGEGNRITVRGYIAGGRHTLPLAVADNRVVRERDAVSMLMGHVSPMFISGRDLLVGPQNMFFQGGETRGVEYSIVYDPAADLGFYVRRPSTPSWLLGPLLGVNADGLAVGSLLPATKIRVAIKARLATAGTQDHWLYIDDVQQQGKTLNWTTSWTVQTWDIDLTGTTAATAIMLAAFGLAGGGAAPLDIQWIGFRPYFADVLSAGGAVVKHEAAATPTGGTSGEVRVGTGKIWVNDEGTWKSVAIA